MNSNVTSMQQQQQQTDKQRSWWKRCTALKRGLIVILLSVILSCTALSIAVALIAAKSGSVNTVARATDTLPPKAEACLLGPLWFGLNRQKKTAVLNISTDVCETDACRHAALMILKNVDDTVDPCENFYRFACGGFIKSTTLPKDVNRIDYITMDVDNAMKRLRLAFEEEGQPNESKLIRQFKIFYKSCMNTRIIEHRGLRPLLKSLKKLGGWPVVDGDSWNESGFDWISLYPKLIKEGYTDTHLFIIDTYYNVTDIYVYLAVLGLECETLINGFSDKTVNAYLDDMVEIATILGANESQARKELNSSLAFEIELAKIPFDYADECRTGFTQETPLSNGTQVNETLIRIFKPLLPVRRDTTKIIYHEPYMSNVISLINGTPKRIVANYFMWRVVAQSLPFLGEIMHKKHRDRLAKYHGYSGNPARWEECLRILSQINPIIVASIYEKKYIKKNDNKRAAEMLMYLRAEYEKASKTGYGQSDRFWSKFKRNIDRATIYNCTFYEEYLDDEEVEAMYKNFEFSEDEYFENYLKATRFLPDFYYGLSRRVGRNITLPREFQQYEFRPLDLKITDLNDYVYSCMKHTYYRPNYVNYATFGFTIVHYRVPLNKPLQCLIDQYSNFTVEKVGQKVNGSEAEKMNFADNLSIKTAYSAYNSWVATNGKEKKLPGIDRTPMQLFWISYANQFCEVYRPEFLRNFITPNGETLSEFRVLGPLTNMPEFARDFMCPVGSKMDPKKKCSFS